MRTGALMSQLSKRYLVSILAALWTFGCSNNPLKPDPNRGDINLNGFSFEISDAVLFSNYFVYGETVFTIDKAAQMAASDVNVDGNQLTVADLVYLTLIINGDASPRPKPKLIPMVINYSHNFSGIMSVNNNVYIGAAFIVVSGQTTPVLLADDMGMVYAYNGTDTRILVWSRDGNSFTGDFLIVSGNVVSLEIATSEGQPTILENSSLELFHLHQNYPNPFSTMARISFALARDFSVSLNITDAGGREVFRHSGFHQAGTTEVDWNGTNQSGQIAPSGTYYCSLTVEGKTQRIKMLKVG
jgi:hypothetical protein